jgi:hypothetical protein
VRWVRVAQLTSADFCRLTAYSHALVMELVEGATLADRIRQGSPIDEALPIAKQISQITESGSQSRRWIC